MLNNSILRFTFFTGFFFLLFASSSFAKSDGEFVGSWTANGTREIISSKSSDLFIHNFYLAGHVNLTVGVEEDVDFWAECYGVGSIDQNDIRCVWRNMYGDSIVLNLFTKQHFQKGAMVEGSIIGGSGNFEGIVGTLSFKWSTIFEDKESGESVLSGYAKGLQGRYIIP